MAEVLWGDLSLYHLCFSTVLIFLQRTYITLIIGRNDTAFLFFKETVKGCKEIPLTHWLIKKNNRWGGLVKVNFSLHIKLNMPIMYDSQSKAQQDLLMMASEKVGDGLSKKEQCTSWTLKLEMIIYLVLVKRWNSWSRYEGMHTFTFALCL